jgi:hypothetical protein
MEVPGLFAADEAEDLAAEAVPRKRFSCPSLSEMRNLSTDTYVTSPFRGHLARIGLPGFWKKLA